MTLTRAARAGGMFFLVTLLALGVFQGNQRPVYAENRDSRDIRDLSGLGTKIVCQVFSDIDAKGPPVNLFPDACRPVPPPKPQCSDGIDNDSDGLIDSADPGCHTDFSASNPASYDPTLNNEGAMPPHGAENTLALCADGIDNDGDGLTDLADPGCTAFKPTLTVKKIVVNLAGGSATASNFNINVTGVSSSDSFPGSSSGTVIAVPLGAYSVSESGGPSGYSMATSSDCTGAMSVGDSKTCVVTNTFQAVSGPTTSDIALTKSVDKTSPNSGDTITYTLQVTNSGPATASNVLATDILPAGLTYVSDDGGGHYASTTGTWTIGALPNGSSTMLHIKASVNAGEGGQTITNSASAAVGNGDPNVANNTATQSITPAAPPNTPPSGGNSGNSGSGGTGGGGGGGNGPVSGSFGVSDGRAGGMVLGASTTTIASSTEESCDTYLTAFIREGRANDPEQVKRLQAVLHDFEGASIPISGIYDAATLAAVHTFQTKYAASILIPWGIGKSTGYVYLTTRKKVNEIYCKNTKQFPLTAQEMQEIAQKRAGVATGASSPPPSVPAPASAPSEAMPAAAPVIVPQEPRNPTLFQAATITAQVGAAAAATGTGKISENPGTLGRFFDFMRNLFRAR